MKTVYEKNLEAIKRVDVELYDELSKIEGNVRYEVFQDTVKDNVNIVDTKENIKFYNNPLEDMQKEIKYFNEYSEHDFLYIFGIGNGIVLKEILKNKKHQQISIIEPNIELIYIAINLHDFSKEILSQKLILMSTKRINFYTILMLIEKNNANLYVKV